MLDGRGKEPLSGLRRNIVAVSESHAITDLFKILTQRKEHIAVVLDEFGGMDGIITMEDIIETLLGLEIMDESDNVADLQELARKNWETRAKESGLIEKETKET